MTDNTDFEVAIIGGGTAGLSAGLTLGRSMRKTIIFDTGLPRNRFAAHAHNFFTQDGTSPVSLLQIGKSQLEPYDSVVFQNSKVVAAVKEGQYFKITTEDSKEYFAGRIILATGLADVLPDIKGFKELWGKKIIHCPYCHGWEVRKKPIALLLNGQVALHLAMLISHWNSDLRIFTNGPSLMGKPDLNYWKSKGVNITETKVKELVDTDDGVEVHFADGTSQTVAAIYSRGEKFDFHDEIALQLGCEVGEEGAIVIDESNMTSVKGVYAAGDLSQRMMHQIVLAAAGGAMAGVFCNNQLIMEDYEKSRTEFLES